MKMLAEKRKLEHETKKLKNVHCLVRHVVLFLFRRDLLYVSRL